MGGRPSTKYTCLAALALALAGCQSQEPTPTAPEVEVLVTKAASEAISLTDELPGRVVAYRVAQIRPQVGGIVQRRFFEQGAMVRAGQPLFQINPAPFRADAASAAGTLDRALATYERARIQADRLKPLVATDAISRQAYDDAVVARNQAAADVTQARAARDRRQLDVGFARITAPISGQIGAANVTEGALVAAGDTNALATVQQIDRVYVDVKQPAARFEQLRDALENGASPSGDAVEIVMAAGRVHGAKGRMLFSDVTVDPGTGNANVRVLVDNPGNRLLPGMFVRARLPRVTLPHAITVPSQAVTRNSDGKAQVAVVNSQGRVHDRVVEAGEVIGNRTVILSGLRAGETVIVVGQDRVQPGVPVKPQPWRAAPKPAR